MPVSCALCLNYAYDGETDEYYCTVHLDEDEYARMAFDSRYDCPFFRMGDDYTIVRRQN